MANRLFVTGSTGFVGKELIRQLELKDLDIVGCVRSAGSVLPVGFERFVVDDITKPDIKWSLALNNIDVVIYTAARAHIMNDEADNPLVEYRKVNCDATLRLARAAAESGVKRFVFVSSVKVNGEMSDLNRPFTPDDNFIPVDPYGLSKYEAEQGLLTIAKKTGMEVVIIRPPLVYGPDVRANFASMLKWVQKGIPLPFGAINNKRSLVALDNLVNFIIHCVDHPKAANEIFLISDGEDVSTTELLIKVSKALGKNNWLIPVATSWMMFLAKLIGKRDEANRLFGSLQVDSSKARNLLGWQPVCTMDEQLKETAEWYLAKKSF
ncbi:MAG: UDP-glucose 4-epimerase [Alteromonas sp. Nap_26]|nr:MAG: UDP-glucose 4-epimerase [Alteromonas sp. Nap_26]